MNMGVYSVKTVINTSFKVAVLLSAVWANADGPCGAGKYLYRCFPARCGEPVRCTMVCNGPRGFADKPSDSISTTIEVTHSNLESNGENANLAFPSEITILNMCK